MWPLIKLKIIWLTFMDFTIFLLDGVDLEFELEANIA